jgi:hypothetical protein
MDRGRALVSHASERWLEAAAGRGFCDERHNAASDLRQT